MERSFFVFGYGTRRCIGETYGAMQVGSLCLQYQMELDPDSPTTPEGMLQSGTMDALPVGLRCDIRFRPV
jgi:cytochrome P450